VFRSSPSPFLNSFSTSSSSTSDLLIAFLSRARRDEQKLQRASPARFIFPKFHGTSSLLALVMRGETTTKTTNERERERERERGFHRGGRARLSRHALMRRRGYDRVSAAFIQSSNKRSARASGRCATRGGKGEGRKGVEAPPYSRE